MRHMVVHECAKTVVLPLPAEATVGRPDGARLLCSAYPEARSKEALMPLLLVANTALCGCAGPCDAFRRADTATVRGRRVVLS